MVRLRPDTVKWLLLVVEFQFLYGTIKTLTTDPAYPATSVFQFLYGTIKTFALRKVFPPPFQFQFLYGTIKTVHNGRRVMFESDISIPVWYD